MKLAPLALALAFLGGAAASHADDAAPQRTVLESALGEFWSVKDETFFVFKSSATKRVTLTGTNIRIVCDNLEITAVGISEKGEKGEKVEKDDKDTTLPTLEKFKYLLATGNVHIVQGEREARAGRAEVFPRENRIVLTESPVVTDHGADTVANGVADHTNDRIFRGARIDMLRGERRVTVYESLFDGPPIRDLGFDKKKAVAEPAPATTQPAESPSPTVTVPGLPPKK